MEDILNLPVQDPPCTHFSAAHINWVKVEGGRQGGDHIALIPFARVPDFVKGESLNPDCPATFRIESRRKRSQGSIAKPRVDGYLQYTLYWCSYGPEDYRDADSAVRGDASNVKPATGKGSRPGRRHMMRGCLCHFTVKRLYIRPLLALIIYNQREHVDKTGAPCHGKLDRDAMGTRAMYAPRISEELRQKVMSMIYAGVSLDNIIQHHMELVQGHGGPHNRDDFLTRNDVRNMERTIRNASHELHGDDGCSVKMWAHRHKKEVFFFQERSCSEPFILGIQTDWQLQQMLRYGQNGSIAFHSKFGSRKLRVSLHPLCTLLVFDSSQNAIPVAWIITSSFIGQEIHKWIGYLAERIRAKDPRWKLNSFLVDDPSFDIPIIRETFQCRVLLCIWHVRRKWIRNLSKKCCSIEIRLEMLKHLGCILYSTRNGPNVLDVAEEFMQFPLVLKFSEEQWIDTVKSLPVAGLELNAAIESYYLRLKNKLFIENNANFWQRVDWLIHILTNEFHSLYWMEQYILETGYVANMKHESFSSNAWHQALNIPDEDVILDEQDLQIAKVISQENRSLTFTVGNAGSEFSVCDCSWSKHGNLCQHVIKVALLGKSRLVARPLLAAQVYRQDLLTLLQNPPDDPVALDHAILHVTRLQQDVKSLEELANNGLLQSLPIEMNSPSMDNPLLYTRLGD
ncbi:hypothetical protein ACFE04_016496 [Oxalis oulophora]